MATFSKKQLNPIIEKYSIDVNSTDFQNIISMFDGATNYQIWAIKGFYSSILNLNELANFKKFATENPDMVRQLSKQTLTAYTSAEDIALLNEEIKGGNFIMSIKKAVEMLNTTPRSIIKNALFPNGKYDGISLLNVANDANFAKIANIFEKVNKFPRDKKDNVIRRTAAMNNYDEIMKFIEGATMVSYTWDAKSLLRYIEVIPEAAGTKVVFNENNIVILEIPNFAASQAICGHGRTGWCITSSESQWKNYVTSKNGKQYFLFDFNRQSKHILAHIGFTVASGKVVTAQDGNNYDIRGTKTVDGKSVSFASLLDAANVPMTLFTKLNGLKGFTWNIEDVIRFINDNSKSMKIVGNLNNRLLVKIESAEAFNKLCSNTFVNGNNFSFSQSSIFVILDLNVPSDREKSMLTLVYNKDRYNSLSLAQGYDGIANKITNDYLSKLGMNIDDMIGANNIDPSILVHKLIDEQKEAELIALLNDKSKAIDVNKDWNDETPVFKAIANGLIDAMNAIMAHPTFNLSTRDVLEVPFLTSLILESRGEDSHGSKEKRDKWLAACMTVAKNPKYDINVVDMTGDTALHEAIQRDWLNDLVDCILDNPNTNINVVDDMGATPLTFAIQSHNQHAIDKLLARPDLKITKEDKAEAAREGITLNRDETITSESSSKIAEAFARIFA